MTVWYDYRAIAGQQAQRIKELEAQLANQDVEWDASHKKAAGMVDNLRARVAELEGMNQDYKAEVEKCFDLAQRLDALDPEAPGTFAGTPSERLIRAFGRITK